MTHVIELHAFDGGIHPAENKIQSTQRPIQPAPLPEELILPLHQHIGAAGIPVVSVGEAVLKGQMIARPEGFVSVPLHASTSGTVTAIEPRAVPHASGLEELCIVLKPDGKDEWIEHQSLCQELGVHHYSNIEPAQLVNRIRESGIAGMGGAGFPTAVKLSVKRDEQGQSPIHTLILNGAECEPYITADDMLMRERAAEVIQGAQILLHILGAKRCLVGVEDNKPEAIKALNEALIPLHEEHHIDVVSIPTKYPSGGEKQLIQILTGEEVPSGGIPANLGIVCQNVSTAAAIHRAVNIGQPLVSRITTVTGRTVMNPGNWEVALGTPVEHLLKQASYHPDKRERVIMGGPMMGFALPDTNIPIIKTSNCLLAPTEQELPTNDMAMACIRCGMCTEACPVQLLPQQLYWFSKSQEFDKAEQHNLFDCIECGACSYVCPSQIPLVQYYRFAKGSIREEREAQAKADRAREHFERRIARQEQEAAEKEAKRKARAEAAAKAKQEKAQQAAAPTADKPAKASTSAGSGVGAATSPALEKLQKQLTAAKTAVTKTKEKLAAAQEAGDETKLTALTTALEKSQTRMKDLAQSIAAEKKALKAAPATDSGTDKGDPNSPERLKRKWETAQARLDTALQRLTAAEAEGLETVPALKEGIAKQQARVDDAKIAYEKAMSGAAQAATATATAAATDVDVDALSKKILAQQDRLTKAQERLSMAQEQNLPTTDALAKGVDKQQQKLDQMITQLPAGTPVPTLTATTGTETK